MKMTITGQIDGKSVPITIPIEKVIEAFWPYATKPSTLSVSTELDTDGISANFMLGQETKDSYPGIWLTSKNSNTGRAGFWFCLELPNETNDMVKGYLYAGDDETETDQSTDVVMLKDCCCIHVVGNVFDGEFDKSESEMKQLYTECLNLAKSIDAIMLCYNPDIDALKAENLSDMAVRLLDGVSRRDVVKDLEDFRDKRRHYNEQAAAESQVILDKISELFEKDGDSK